MKKVKNDKKVNPLVGIILFLVSVILIMTTAPVGFVFGILWTLIKTGFTGLGSFCLQLALSLDQLGNVCMQHLFNAILIKATGYPFGNPDETISSVVGKNQQANTLSRLGQILNGFLDLFDKNHSLDSREYEI